MWLEWFVQVAWLVSIFLTTVLFIFFWALYFDVCWGFDRLHNFIAVLLVKFLFASLWVLEGTIQGWGMTIGAPSIFQGDRDQARTTGYIWPL